MVGRIKIENFQRDSNGDGELKSFSIKNDDNFEMNFMHKKLNGFRKSIVQEVENRFDCMIDEVMQEMRQHQLRKQEFQNFAIGLSNNNNNFREQNDLYYNSRNTWSNRILHDDDTIETTSTTTTATTTTIDAVIHDSNISNHSSSVVESPITDTTTSDNAQQEIRKRKLQKEISNESIEQYQKSLSSQISNNSSNPSDYSKNSESIHYQRHRRHHRMKFPAKVFQMRESYLTALLEVDHMRAIYHIFYTIFVVLLLHTIAHDYFVQGSMNFGLGTFKIGLAKLHYVLGILVFKHLFVFLVYYAVRLWIHVRVKIHHQESMRKCWDICCLITYIASQLLFGYVAPVMCLRMNLPFVSASVLLLESIRLMMKMHSFVRSNAPRFLQKLKNHDDDGNDDEDVKNSVVPPFSCFLYFLFAPTFIYRDHYPRTTQIRWKFVLARFLEVVAIAFIYSYIYERYLEPYFGAFGLEELNAAAWIVKIFGMFMPGVIVFLCGFYLILHSWLNFTSELLRFGDRMFYKNWWTASSFDAYFRNWNVVVHDFLYEFVYKDCCNYLFGGSKVAASLMVFAVSAVAHEILLGFALQLFFPVLFFFFGFVGVACFFLTQRAPKHLGNFFLWFSIISGFSMTISLYCIEFFARHNCPKQYDNLMDYLTPTLLSCYQNK